MPLTKTADLLPRRATPARLVLACLSIILIFQTAAHHFLTSAVSAETKAPVFRVPANTEIDWEVDQLLRVRVLLPADAILEQYSKSQIKALVDHLEDPDKYIAAHVMLSKLNGDVASSRAIPCEHGFDLWCADLKIQLRYISAGAFDRKTIVYPEKGIANQKMITQRWKDQLNKFQSFQIADRPNHSRKLSISFETWCDNSSSDLQGVTNARVKWECRTFGIARPVLQKVHRKEIAYGNTKHVPHLMTLLNDESRCVAAHIALCCIFGITESYHHVHGGNGYHLYLNGLHVLYEQGAYTYPHLARQQAWLKYRWETSLPWLMRQGTNRDN